jgi:alpha-L-fucosidase
MNNFDKKLEYLDWEYGIFFHFGIRAFYPGHEDWDEREMPLEKFDPKELDCESWIRTAKEAGAKYAILTAKHHDGFALWPSKYSTYGVKNTPWKGGKGDVVREYVDACRKYGLKVGLYYSPAQWGGKDVVFTNEREYDDYFINQISELLTDYGKIDYLWFDGCGSENHEYDKKRIVNAINELQPEILTFCDPEWSPGVRWIGNEDGYASLDNPLVVSNFVFSELANDDKALKSAMFLPGECDAKIRGTWFYDNNEDTLKSVDELFGMYEMSVGHGSNFLLNIGPDYRGLLPECDTERVLELGKRIKESYGNPLPYSVPKVNGNVYTMEHLELKNDDWQMPYESRLSNCIVIKEDLRDGQKIESFSIYGYCPRYQNKKIHLFEGKTVGHKVICKFSPLRCSKYEIVINKQCGDSKIKSIEAYFVK